MHPDGTPVEQLGIEEIMCELEALVWICHRSDLLWGEGRAVAEVFARCDLLIAELVERHARDDWGPKPA